MDFITFGLLSTMSFDFSSSQFTSSGLCPSVQWKCNSSKLQEVIVSLIRALDFDECIQNPSFDR